MHTCWIISPEWCSSMMSAQLRLRSCEDSLLLNRLPLVVHLLIMLIILSLVLDTRWWTPLGMTLICRTGHPVQIEIPIIAGVIGFFETEAGSRGGGVGERPESTTDHRTSAVVDGEESRRSSRAQELELEGAGGSSAIPTPREDSGVAAIALSLGSNKAIGGEEGVVRTVNDVGIDHEPV